MKKGFDRLVRGPQTDYRDCIGTNRLPDLLQTAAAGKPLPYAVTSQEVMRESAKYIYELESAIAVQRGWEFE